MYQKEVYFWKPYTNFIIYNYKKLNFFLFATYFPLELEQDSPLIPTIVFSDP